MGLFSDEEFFGRAQKGAWSWRGARRGRGEKLGGVV